MLAVGKVCAAYDRHAVQREGTGLIRTDDLSAAKGLDGGQLSDNCVALAHLGNADGERDGDDGRQALGDGGNGKAHGDHECVHDKLKANLFA